MIRGRYGLLIAGVVVAMLSVAAGAKFLMDYAALPDPSVATRQELFHWLVLRDLSKESEEIRQKILVRLDAESDKIAEMGPRIENMTEAHRKTLWQNVTLLLEPWLLDKAHHYAQLAAAQQEAYLDRFIDQAETWATVGSACSKNANNQAEGSKGPSISKAVMESIQQCTDRAEPNERRQIESFMAAVKMRWLMRHMPSFNLFGKPALSPQASAAQANAAQAN